MFEMLLGLLLLWYLDKNTAGAKPKASPGASTDVAPGASPGVSTDAAPSQEDSGLSELGSAISEHLNQHGGLHTASELASALGEPQDQVQQALDELRDQGQVSDVDGRYGTPDEAQALRDLVSSIRDQLAKTAALDTSSELASALGQPQAQVQQALDELKAQGEVTDFNGRYGTPAEVEQLRELGHGIVAYLQDRDELQTASELASALGQPEAQVQQALDQLQAQGQVGEWDGHYGVPDEVAELQQLGSDILSQLDQGGLQTAAELASALGQSEDDVQQALDQLKAQGKVDDVNGRYGTPAQVQAARELSGAIATQLAKTAALDTAAELASALGRPEAEVQQALDQLKAQGVVKDLNGRYGTPVEVDKQMALEQAAQEEQPVAEQAPPLSDCLKLDGGDGCISLGQQSDYEPQQELTIEAWVNAAKREQWDGIVSRVFHTGGTQSGYGLLLDGSSGIYFTLKTTAAGIDYLSSGANTLPLNSWHHVAGTYDGKQMRVYIDGVEKATKARFAPAIDYDPAHDLYIGQYKDNNETHPLEGQVSDVRIWDRALTPEEIRANMNRRLSGNESGLTGYWPLDEGEGETAHDRSGNGHDGQLNGGAGWEKDAISLEPAVTPPTIIGVGTNNYLYTRDTLTSEWKQVPNSGSVKSVTVMPDGTVVGVGMGNTLWTRDSLTSPWQNIPNSGSVIDVTTMPDGTLLAVGTDRQLYTRDTLTSDWKLVPKSGNPANMAVMPDGTFICAAYGQLYTRKKLDEAESPTANWSVVPNSGSVIGVNVMPDGTIIGIGTDRQLYTRQTVTSAWELVPNSGAVIDVEMFPTEATGDEQPAAVEKTYALELNGSNTSVSVPDNEALRITAYTVEVLIKPDGKPNETWKGIVGKPGRNYNIWLNTNGSIHHAFHNAATYNHHFDTPANSVPWNQWSHIAITNDGATATTYINGTKQAENTSGGVPLVDNTTLYMGQNLDGRSQQYFKGQMAEVRIWDHVRSEDDIQADMNRRSRGDEAGLVGYWPLDEGEGNVAHDRSSNGNDGPIQGAAWGDDAGHGLGPAAAASSSQTTVSTTTTSTGDGAQVSTTTTGTSTGVQVSTTTTGTGAEEPPVELVLQPVLQFNRGAQNYVEVGEPFENDNTFTVSLWVKPSVLNDGRFHGFIGKQDDTRRKPSMWVRPGKNGFHYDSYALNGRRFHGSFENFFTRDEWVHVAWVKDGREYRVYRDGELFTTERAPARFYTAATSYWIGRVENFFRGQLAEVRIWNHARSESEINVDMHRRLSGTENGLVAYWQLNEGEGEIIHDRTANANQGTIHGATWAESALPLPKVAAPVAQAPVPVCALAFDGTNDYVEVPYTQVLNPARFTISCWVKVTGGQRAFRSPLTSRSDPPSRGYIIYAANNNHWAFWTGGGRRVGDWVGVTGQAVALNQWIHVAATFDGTTMKSYLNGSLAAESAVRYAPNRERPLRIGAGATEGRPQFPFNGQIAEVRVWNLARSEAQIKADMNRQLSGNERGLVGYWPLDEGRGRVARDRTDNANNGTIRGATWRDDAGPALVPRT